ncbi:hypothetical protein L1987_15291 [Smallanthus sonchifolius]|uniref:Uncharacterized protein n=1 Tax=Smallanthus sonchifolius TaxID=185202 RepID=A0ACB9J5Z9_9ASTR|nr:hypothetical protein L1987_15291 [Smallanthus sonchifolius]
MNSRIYTDCHRGHANFSGKMTPLFEKMYIDKRFELVRKVAERRKKEELKQKEVKKEKGGLENWEDVLKGISDEEIEEEEEVEEPEDEGNGGDNSDINIEWTKSDEDDSLSEADLE